MNDAVLNHFRNIADNMGLSNGGWCWVGKHLSQQMFDISEKRAKAYAARHGGDAMTLEQYDAKMAEVRAKYKALNK